MWWVYVLCSTRRNRTYVGCTTDPARRIRQHNGEIKGGAKCTRAHRPWAPGALYGPYPDRSAACKAEWHLKHKHRGPARLSWTDEAHACGPGAAHPWVEDPSMPASALSGCIPDDEVDDAPCSRILRD